MRRCGPEARPPCGVASPSIRHSPLDSMPIEFGSEIDGYPADVGRTVLLAICRWRSSNALEAISGQERAVRGR